jgi:hypothetical protein
LFCSKRLSDEGLGFVIHVEESRHCRDRWLDWLDLIRGDAGGD